MIHNEFADAVQSHHQRNAELVQRLEQRGVDLTCPRIIEHHFWAHGQAQGEDLARELERRGLVVRVLARVAKPDEARELWNVEAEIEQSVREAVSEDVVSAMVEVAQRFGAVYDGWGTRLG